MKTGVARGEASEKIVGSRVGDRVVTVAATGSEPRVLGQWRGLVEIGDDFDAPLPGEVLAAFTRPE